MEWFIRGLCFVAGQMCMIVIIEVLSRANSRERDVDGGRDEPHSPRRNSQVDTC